MGRVLREKNTRSVLAWDKTMFQGMEKLECMQWPRHACHVFRERTACAGRREEE